MPIDYQVAQGLNNGLGQFWDAFKGERDRSQQMALQEAQMKHQKQQEEEKMGLEVFKQTGDASYLSPKMKSMLGGQQSGPAQPSQMQQQPQSAQPQSKMIPGQPYTPQVSAPNFKYPETSEFGRKERERYKGDLDTQKTLYEFSMLPTKQAAAAQDLKKGKLDIADRERTAMEHTPAGMAKKLNYEQAKDETAIVAKKQAAVDELGIALKQLEDPKMPEDQKIIIGQMLLKKLNDPLMSDAIGKEEVERIGAYLTQFSLTRPGSTFGRDIPRFTAQVRNKKSMLDEALKAQNSRISGLLGVQAAQPQAPQEDSEAMAWANANPQDPRAIKIKQLNGAK